MSATVINIHCTDGEPRELKLNARYHNSSNVDDFCALRLDSDIHSVTFFYPTSMFDRIARAADAFNAALSEPVIPEALAN